MLLDLLAILAPIFICAAIGFAWARLQRGEAAVQLGGGERPGAEREDGRQH